MSPHRRNQPQPPSSPSHGPPKRHHSSTKPPAAAAAAGGGGGGGGGGADPDSSAPPGAGIGSGANAPPPGAPAERAPAAMMWKDTTPVEVMSRYCEMLSTMVQSELQRASVDAIVPRLLSFLEVVKGNREFLVLTVRALTHLCDAVPWACTEAVRHRAIRILCGRLLTYDADNSFELMEQSLQAIMCISQEEPSACLHDGALTAVLSVIDLVSPSIKRVALSAAVIMCKNIKSDAVDLVMEAVPLLANLLRHDDSKVLEHASICLISIFEAFIGDPDTLDRLCQLGLVARVVELISTAKGQASLSTFTYKGLLQLLSSCVSGSTLAVETLHRLGISRILKSILLPVDLATDTFVPTALTRTPDQIYEIVNLANELLPTAPDGNFSDPISHATSSKGHTVKRSPAGTSEDPHRTSCANKRILLYENLLRNQPELLLQFGMDLLPLLIQINISSIYDQVRSKSLSVIGKLICSSTSHMINSLLSVSNVPSFLSGLLLSKHPVILIWAMFIADVLMVKLPQTFSKMLAKEGFVHAIDSLIKFNSTEVPTSADFPSENVSKCAKNFKRKYFTCLQEAAVGIPDDLRYLKNLCNFLTSGVEEIKDSSLSKAPTILDFDDGEESLSGIISNILRVLSEADRISTFQFINSGVVNTLLNYFACGSFAHGSMSDGNSNELLLKTLKRCRSFIETALTEELSRTNEVPMTFFVRKLQNALSTLECFPIILSHPKRYSSIDAVVSSRSALSRPVKIRFSRAQGEKLHDFSSEIVLVEPLARLKAVEEFLWPRVQRSASDQMPISSQPTVTVLSEEVNLINVADDGAIVSSIGRNQGESSTISTDDCLDKLEFSFEGRRLDKSLTVYHAITNQKVLDEHGNEIYDGHGSEQQSDDNTLWTEIFTLTYEKANSQIATAFSVNPTFYMPKSSGRFVSSHRGNTNVQLFLLVGSIFQRKLQYDPEITESTYNILQILHLLEFLNRVAPQFRALAVCHDFAAGKISSFDQHSEILPRVPPEEFINNKLTSKLKRQIQDALVLCSRSLPSWCYQLTKVYPFLFPFETRRQYFYFTAFGFSHMLHHVRQQQEANSHTPANERVAHAGRLQHQKVNVARDHILKSAAKVMDLFAGKNSILNVLYFGEVGTGRGPTVEFYTHLSQEFQMVKLGLWRSNSLLETQDEGDERVFSVRRRDLVQAPLGLFPCPWPPNSNASDGSQLSEVVRYFHLLGQLTAKALKDGHLLDLPLSPAFYKLILGQELDLYDIFLFDPEFGKSLQEMQAINLRKQFLDATDNQKAISDLRLHGASVEDLSLDFTLPGYPGYILKEGNTMVDISNLEEYISLVVDATVKTGIMRQIESFRTGFNKVFDISSLQIFSPHELDILLCGQKELWEPGSLVDHINFEHGYTATSPAIVNLLEILGGFTLDQQRAFCLFVTGSPRLPPGGLAALEPKLTIVEKSPRTAVGAPSDDSAASKSVDNDLPTVMTCAHYLKLPPYSTKEIMYKKLLYAIYEGQGSFDLS